MKALVLHGTMDFSYEERPYPVCSPGNIVMKVNAVCICGSDMHAIRGNQPLFRFPRVLGHEVAGIIVEIGSNVHTLQVGDRVCLMPCISCGECRACRRGNPNCCEHLRLYGVQEDGGLQEYLCVPEQALMRVSPRASAEEICMIEPLTIGAHGVERLGLCEQDYVLVLGGGPIGVSCALNARTYGAKVILAEPNEQRRAFVQKQFQLEILDPFAYNYNQQIKQLTNGALFDAVIDTTAVKTSMDSAWKWIGHGGRILFVGMHSGMLEIEQAGFHMKEPALFVTRNSTPRDFARVIQLWEQGKLIPALFVTHTTTFEEASQTLLKWTSPEAGVFKGVVRM